MRLFKLVLGLFVMILTGCASRPLDPSSLVGTWGGSNGELIIFATGADFEDNCSDGQIATTFVVDEIGNFDLEGVLDLGFCSPSARVPCEPNAKPKPAQFTGHVSSSRFGQVMSLTISSLTPDSFQPREFTLRHGTEGDIGPPCP